MGSTNDTYELIVQGIVADTQHIHTLHFRQVTPALKAEDLVTSYMSVANATYRGIFSSGDRPWMIVKAHPVCGTPPLEAGYEVATSAPNDAGTRTGTFDSAASFVAGLVTLKTGLAGRTRQGRFFLGGLHDADYARNDVGAGYVTMLNAYCNALKAAYVTPGTSAAWRLVIHSRKLAAVPGTQCQDSSAPVTTLTVSPYVTTMRSRKKGHGL